MKFNLNNHVFILIYSSLDGADKIKINKDLNYSKEYLYLFSV